jgi:hypothetical protein
VLRRIAALVEAGATVVGPAPEGSPGLKDDRGEYGALVHRLWSGGEVTRVGQGRLIARPDAGAALAASGVGPDFAFAKADSEILFVHRRLADGDLYFLSNRKNRAESGEARFRVAGKAPEIWRADTGKAEPVSYRIEGGETLVPLDLLPEESLFLVFRKPAAAASLTVDRPMPVRMAELDGAWDVAFQPGRGAPASIKLPRLASLSDQKDPGVKYFSGVATYSTSFTLPREAKPGAPLMLDLGTIGDVAEISVNGTKIGTVWHAPYRIEIGAATKKGDNKLEVRVANLWVNRLIGDAQPNANKITFTTLPTYQASAPLRPSGLIGPVTLLGPATLLGDVAK